MRPIFQVLRQPLKSAAGIILVSLAVAIAVTCAGQYAATSVTRANLDDRYDTVALVSDEYFWVSNPRGRTRYFELPEDIQSWIANTVRQRPDLVKAESYTDLYSAYAPGLLADNFSHYENGDMLIDMDYTENAAYRGAMLEVTLTKVGTIFDEDVSEFRNGAGESQIMLNHTTMLCAGTVDRVVSMEQGFASPVGKSIALMITAYSEDELNALHLCAGDTYLVYGMDYSDLHGMQLHHIVDANLSAFEELYGTAEYDKSGAADTTAIENQVDCYIANQIDCYMTVCDYSALPWNYAADGEFVALTDQREYYTRDEDGIHMTPIPAEEYIPDYRVPTIVKLDGSVEDFLESEQGALWQTTIEEMEISHHGFPVLAVDKLGYQITFAREDARIVEGRDFTESERTDGSKVCIISETVAAANDLEVGDTIALQTYGYDPNIQVQQMELRTSTSFPSAAVYSRAMGFTSDLESYTIVGLYRQSNAWQNRSDPYGITPNTIFVPKSSMTGDALVGKSGIFYTMVLQNGMMDAFMQYQADAGYPDLFVCLDQGYGEIAAELDAYERVSANALIIGIVCCVGIMFLFVILFPLGQRKTLAIMNTLGASRGKRICYMVAFAACLLIPGAVIGGFAGSLLWERVAAALREAVNVQIPLEADMRVLAPGLTAGVVVLMMAVTLLAAVLVSGSRGRARGK